jgi:hypothetical protein
MGHAAALNANNHLDRAAASHQRLIPLRQFPNRYSLDPCRYTLNKPISSYVGIGDDLFVYLQ